MAPPTRAYRAGESLEDFCRACKTDRIHTVIVADANGLPIRVSGGFCHSEHNYRGGPRISGPERAALRPHTPDRETRSATRNPFPIPSYRERPGTPRAH